jgi:hypothetical protein
MNWMLILLGIVFLIILSQIHEGEIMSSIKYGVRKIDRKTQPLKFWMNIAVQLAIWAAFVLYQPGYIAR